MTLEEKKKGFWRRAGAERTLRAVHVILIQVTFLGSPFSWINPESLGEKRGWKNGWEKSLKHSARSENVRGIIVADGVEPSLFPGTMPRLHVSQCISSLQQR